jgi:Uma2 family endonuclease
MDSTATTRSGGECCTWCPHGDSKDDFRVPDGGLHREPPRGTWFPTAALALEVLSPDDESWEKLPFYAAHEVDEVLIVDLDKRKVQWLALLGNRYEPIERSRLLDLDAAQLTQQIDWP